MINIACQGFAVLNELIYMKHYSDFNFLALDSESLINKTLPNFSKNKKANISMQKKIFYVSFSSMNYLDASSRVERYFYRKFFKKTR
jgi:hypothetical protein